MTLQFIIGKGHSDYHQQLILAANEWLQADSKNEAFFLVPNYNKFEQERQILEEFKILASKSTMTTTRMQVFSFQRLAWYFLEKTTLLAHNELTEAGAAMIFRQVLQENAEELTVFRGEVKKKGFIDQLYSLYTEFASANISPMDLIKEATNPKFKDLHLIFSNFERVVMERQIQMMDPLQLLNQHLEEIDLSHVHFYISGFTRFNAKELSIIQKLMATSQVTISLLLDQAYPTEKPSPLNLFRETGELYFRLKQYATMKQIPLYFDKVGKEKQAEGPLVNLATVWEKTQNQEPLKPLTLPNQDAVHLWSFANPTEEIHKIAKEIRYLVKEKGYRYQDIQLLTRDEASYHHLLPAIFSQYDLPIYLDENQKMEEHPLIEFFRALFALNKYDFRQSDVFRLLRTELYLPTDQKQMAWEAFRNEQRRKIDLAENIVLAYNYQGYHWRQEKDWQFILYDFEEESFQEEQQLLEEVNDVRKMIQSHIPKLFTTLAQETDTKQALVTFYQFLQEVGVKDQLLAWRNQEVNRGHLQAARNHEQTWQAFIQLLEDYLLIYEKVPFDWELFQEVLSTGLDHLSYGGIPTAIDPIQVGNIDLVRENQGKVVFALGLNQQVFPKKYESTGLLTPEERQHLNQNLDENQYLYDETTQGVSREPLTAYLLYLSASEKLYLSYAGSYDSKKELKQSPYVERVQYYLSLPLETFQPLNLTTSLVGYYGTYRSLLSDLNVIKRLSQDNHQDLPKAWRLSEQLLLASDYSQLTKQVLASQTALNVPTSLSQELAEDLYGKDLYASISRMESFYNCQYKYFATYGLGLKERNVYALTPAVTGDFYHEALDAFFSLLIQNNLSLTSLTPEERMTYVDDILLQVFGEAKFTILQSSARMNYIRFQLGQTIQKVGWALQKQSQRTGMTPVQTEVVFGQIGAEKGLPGIEVPLVNGGTLYLRGKIDRVDIAENQDHAWLSVVDYKSSSRKFDMTEAYYGLAMQLITYLDVALMNSVHLVGDKATQPAGAYYFHVYNPVLSTPEKVEEETLKKYSYEGIFVDSPTVFPILDASLEEKQSSLLYPLRKNAKGEYQKNGMSKDKFVTADEITTLINHNRAVMKEAGDAIVSGDIQLNPAYKDKQRVACQYCPFRSVCTFDVMLKENNYHRLTKLSKAEAIEKMATKGDLEND